MKIAPLLLAASLFSPSLVAAASAAAKKPTAKKTTKKSSVRRRVPPPPRVSAKVRQAARETVESQLNEAKELGIQNAAAMVPFYERMFRQDEARQASTVQEPLRVLHFGDSHTASDDWPNSVRLLLQQQLGIGGPGFVHAGRPYAGFRRHDAKSSMSKGWKPEGLLNREADGLSGISGVSVAASRAGETLSLEASGSLVEVYYLQQPGGGAFVVEDDGVPLDTIHTDAELAPGFWQKELPPGPHLLTLRTLSNQPVRVQGWSMENPGGATWEMLGINGAQADLLLGWNPTVLAAHIERRDPALIVLAYGTNEARKPDWTLESYKQALLRVIHLFRAAAPAASILIVGAPDQMFRGRRKITPVENLSQIVAAQKDAAFETGCAFWNLRAAMGGRSSMQQWVRAGFAQGDYVHLTSEGYRLWGQALFDLISSQYGIFQSVRRQYMGNQTTNGPTLQTR